MAHGGKRHGSGRKLGSASKKTKEIADRAAKEGITPLEVMLDAMKKAYKTGDSDKAVDYARSAAPYIHPKLQAVEHKNKDGEPFKACMEIIFR